MTGRSGGDGDGVAAAGYDSPATGSERAGGPLGAAPTDVANSPGWSGTEDALRLASARFEAALQATHITVSDQDRQLRYTWIHNPPLGYAPSEVVGQRDTDLFARPSDAHRTEAIKRAVIESGVGQRHEVPVLHAGVERWFDLVVQPKLDAAGAVIGVTCAAVDITERKHGELAQALMVELNEAVGPLATARDLAEVTVETIARRLGVAACALVEMADDARLATVFHERRVDDVPSLLGDFAVVEYLREDERQRLKAGQAVTIADVRDGGRATDAVDRFEALQVRALMLIPYSSYGRITFVLAATHREPYDWRGEQVRLMFDVAAQTYLRLERARAVDALRAARDTFHHLVSQSPFGVYAVDADFRLVQVSAGAQRVFENVRPLLGRDFAEVLRTIWPEPFASEAIARFRATLETGEAYHAPSMVERRHDTAQVEAYDWKIERVMLPDGRFGVVCHFYDLSDRERDEAALRESERQKDEFLAMLAHELRNPLAPLLTCAGLLRARAVDDPLVVRCSDVIDRQVSQMARLLDDLLDIARLSRGRLVLVKTVVSVREVVLAAIETSRPIVDQRRQQLEMEWPDDDLLVEGDATRLAQVFSNVLNNAAKYSHPGGSIRISARREGHVAAVRVRDTGIGIAPAMLDRIFELFTRGDAADESAPDGLGIGLALSRRVVELHGGSIVAKSAGLGHGSEFIVSIPLQMTPAGPALTAVPTASGGPAKPALSARVLIADDNEDAADSLSVLLAMLGCDVRTVHDGEAAVQAVEAFLPDVVLLDLSMPGVGGLEACQRIRRTSAGARATVVAVSGWGQQEDRQRCAEAGFDRHLTKPVRPDVLVELIGGVRGG